MVVYVVCGCEAHITADWRHLLSERGHGVRSVVGGGGVKTARVGYDKQLILRTTTIRLLAAFRLVGPP